MEAQLGQRLSFLFKEGLSLLSEEGLDLFQKSFRSLRKGYLSSLRKGWLSFYLRKNLFSYPRMGYLSYSLRSYYATGFTIACLLPASFSKINSINTGSFQKSVCVCVGGGGSCTMIYSGCGAPSIEMLDIMPCGSCYDVSSKYLFPNNFHFSNPASLCQNFFLLYFQKQFIISRTGFDKTQRVSCTLSPKLTRKQCKP